MDAAREARLREKKELLNRLAELMVEEQVAEGVFLGTPHFSVIEQAAVHLGRELSCQAQKDQRGQASLICPAGHAHSARRGPAGHTGAGHARTG